MYGAQSTLRLLQIGIFASCEHAEVGTIELAEEPVGHVTEFVGRAGAFGQLVILFGQRRPIEALHGGVVELLPEDAGGLAYDVVRFVEKPDEHRAQAYLASGHFGWNSGMFVWKASTVMACLERFKPECFAGLRKIQDAWGTADQ